MAIYVKDLEVDLYRGIKNLELNNLSDINILTGIIIQEKQVSLKY